MKALHVLSFSIITLLFSNCEESQNYRPLKRINGEWQIKQLRFKDQRTGKDSTARPASARLIFNQCSKEENKRPTVCEGSYQVEGQSFVFLLTYQVTGNSTVSIQGKSDPSGVTSQYRRIEDVLASGYEIRILNDTDLYLVGQKECIITNGGVKTCRYITEIEAVRRR